MLIVLFTPFTLINNTSVFLLLSKPLLCVTGRGKKYYEIHGKIRKHLVISILCQYVYLTLLRIFSRIEK